jgi:hypothetical protein
MSDRGFLFSWDDIPGKDSRQFLNHLEKCAKIDWVKNAEIKKDSTNKTITVTDGTHSLTLKIENVAVLYLGDGETYEYDVKREEGKTTIYSKEALFILRELDFENDKELRNLANAVSEKSLKDPRAMVKALHSEDENESLKASSVLLNIEDLALGPLFEALSPEVPERWVWDMQTVVDLQVNNRLRIAEALETMLDDKRPVEMPEHPGAEEQSVPRRVCDEAYLLMRKLLAFEETEEEQFFGGRDFLSSSDEEKDSEIRRARTSKRWAPLTEQFSQEE